MVAAASSTGLRSRAHHVVGACCLIAAPSRNKVLCLGKLSCYALDSDKGMETNLYGRAPSLVGMRNRDTL